MRVVLRRLGLLVMLAALVACQPLPQPFADDAPPPGSPLIQTPRDGAGVMVRPVAGLPEPLGTTVAEAMAQALQESDVAASTQLASKASQSLVGTAEERTDGPRANVALHWELRDPDGTVLGTQEQSFDAPLAAWRAGEPALLKRVAKSAAPKIADLMQDEGTRAAATSDPPVVVRQVRGAPGDGSKSLARAMRTVLRQAKLSVPDGEKTAEGAKAFTVDGSVAIAPPGEGKQKVKVTWALFDPEGAQVGQVSQENAVNAGSLDGAWGEVAYAVAGAAADGILALLDRAKSSRAGS
jgi:hypothetical protein